MLDGFNHQDNMSILYRKTEIYMGTHILKEINLAISDKAGCISDLLTE